MPTVTRSLRALAVAPLLLSLLLGLAPSPTAALEPPRPLPAYHPRFVTQTDEHPMNDCLWASAAMLIQKWTNGKVHPSHQRLRALSGDRSGGSNLDDLKIAYRKLGFNLKFSPDGGNRITFRGLLRRLAHGAGAVVLGDDSQLPGWYGRWDYGFWKMTKKEKKKHPSRDNHAVYVERFDRRHGRVWLMDPLAHGKWHGEWISTYSLSRFAWSSGGAVFAAVTPNAKPAPFAHVRISAATLSESSASLQAQWSFRARRKWRFPGVTTHTAFTPAADPIAAAAKSPSVADRATEDTPPTHTLVAASARALTIKAPLPTKPGAYLGSIKLTDRRFGRTVSQVGGVPVFVPGPRHATLSLDAATRSPEAGKGFNIAVSVANSGEVSWANPPDRDDAPAQPRNTRLVARWVPLAVDLTHAPAPHGATNSKTSVVPAPMTIETVPLDSDAHAARRRLASRPVGDGSLGTHDRCRRRRRRVLCQARQRARRRDPQRQSLRRIGQPSTRRNLSGPGRRTCEDPGMPDPIPSDPMPRRRCSGTSRPRSASSPSGCARSSMPRCPTWWSASGPAGA